MPQPKKPAPAPAAPPSTPEEVVEHLNALRERLVSSLTLTTDRLQDAIEDAVRRGRMTRKDAELRKVRDHERRHAKRKSVPTAIERKLG
jgi:hypothetical protein